jgi:CarD family transcriptional regulator
MPKKKAKKIKKKSSIKKVYKNKAKTKIEKKTETPPLRIANSNKYRPEDKIEIKKIKKQATEKKIYSIKDFVVYPKHGVGKIVSI